MQSHQVMAGSKNNTALFDGAHAGGGTAVTERGAFTYFHKHGGTVIGAHDEVDFAAATSWRSIIANQQPQSLVLQVAQGFSLGCVTDVFGAGPRIRSPGWF